VNCVSGGSSLSDLSFTYSYVTFPYFGCLNWMYYDPVSNTCGYNCPALEFPNADLVCVSCRFDCLTCHATRYLHYANYSCLPLPGHYDTHNSIAPPCDSPCATCHASASSCTSCLNDTLFLSSHACLNCS
jgi:hypothetical protein